MSQSDTRHVGEFSRLIDSLEAAERREREPYETLDISFDEGGRLLGIAVRLYVKGAETAGDVIESVPALGLTATEAVVGASALLKDQDLTPFDLWLWFQRVMREAKSSNSFTNHLADMRAQERPSNE